MEEYWVKELWYVRAIKRHFLQIRVHRRGPVLRDIPISGRKTVRLVSNLVMSQKPIFPNPT